MKPGRLDPSTQTLYAEFLDRLRLREAHRSIGDVRGTFVTKTVRGRVYYYFQFSRPGGITQQIYLGEKTRSLEELLQRFEDERPTKEKERADLARLCSQLRTGGALATPHPVARVLDALAESGIFRVGGVLIGTHAFTVLGNALAASWPSKALQTLDIDLAIPPVGIVLPQGGVNLPDTLTQLGMGFLPVPPLDHKHPSTSFKVRGHPLRLDVLTPLRGREIKVLFLPQFNTGACGLPYLDYLLEEPLEGGIVGADGILVRVPAPARFAFHKLLVSQLRAGAQFVKSGKDLLQATQILSFLTDERPGDVDLAWEAVAAKGKRWVGLIKQGLAAVARQFPESYEPLRASMARFKIL